MKWIAAAALLALGFAACAKDETKLGLALNWKPEPEFGGIFEAERLGCVREILVIAAAICYVPANVLPVLTTNTLVSSDSDTIMNCERLVYGTVVHPNSVPTVSGSNQTRKI
jgi:hypothetical protein